MYTYVTEAEYFDMGYSVIPAEDLTKALSKASRSIDGLTFNRIVRIGFDNLTDFQKEIVKTCVCEQAEFLYSNADAISSILSKYSINSVSMEFGTGFNVLMESGQPVQKTTYALLEQTGLCWRGAI